MWVMRLWCFCALIFTLVSCIGGRNLVACGDFHGDFENAIRALHLTGVVSDDGTWCGNDTVLVQTGDVVDRGEYSIEILDYLADLKEQATSAGGEVVTLMGNHELMNLRADFRYVNPREIQRAGGKQAWKELFSPNGRYGKLISNEHKGAAVRGEGNCRSLFVHAGMHPGHIKEHVESALADDGTDVIETLNDVFRTAVKKGGYHSLLEGDGIVWWRGLAHESASNICPKVKELLSVVGANRIVIGHTIQEKGITTRCDGMVQLIDVGMSRAYKGRLAAWQCDEDGVRHLYPHTTHNHALFPHQDWTSVLGL